MGKSLWRHPQHYSYQCDRDSRCRQLCRRPLGRGRRLFAPIKLEKDSERQKLLLSQLIISKCENFFIKPSVAQGWGDDKRKFIETAYQQSAATRVEVNLDPRLMLFP